MAHKTAVAQLTEAEVILSIEDFLFRDGPYLEREHRLLARKCGLNEEGIARLWQNAAEHVQQNLATTQAKFGGIAGRFDALRPKIEDAKAKLAEQKQVEPAKPALSYRRYVTTGASFILPATQPKVESDGKDNSARKAVVAKFIEARKPEPIEEPEEEPEELEPPEEEPAPEDDEKAIEGEIVTSSQVALPITSTEAKAVALLNRKHHVIGNYGNKCVILSWELWEINHNVMIPTFQRFIDFTNRYMNRYVWRQTKNGLDKVPAGRAWLSNPHRKTYDSVAFKPNDEREVLPGNRLNLWRGFGVFPRQGSWKLMHDHIYDVLGAGDPQSGLYIIRWLAYTLQHPDVVGETVLVLQGHEGTGKGTLARAMLKVFGPHGLPVTQPKHLIGGFSGHLQQCCFLFLDEAFWAGDVSAEGRLKSLITEDTITIEPKYFTPFQVPNLLHILMSSNNDWVVPAGPHARRYAVFKVSDKRMDDFAYFTALRSELDNGGVEAMLYDLRRLDLGNWHPMQIYKTAALTEQKARSLRGLDAWIETMLQEGSLPYGGRGGYPNRALTEDLTEHAKQFDRYTNKSLVPRELKKYFPMKDFGTGSARGWKFPPLPECRRLFEARFGPWDWHCEIDEWQGRGY